MPHAIRILASSALALSLSAAAAFACEDATAKAIAKAAEKAAKAACDVHAVKMAIDVTELKRCIDIDVKTNKVINAQPRRSGWSPGHLIEPDSMKHTPGNELIKSPETEQWVIISARKGTIHFRQYPRGGKNIEGRTLQQYGP